jgi:hypothetical protein
MGCARCVRSASRKAEPFAHILAAQTPVITAMRENQQPVRRGSREPNREAAIDRTVAGSWRKYLTAAYLAAEHTRYIAQIHCFTPALDRLNCNFLSSATCKALEQPAAIR